MDSPLADSLFSLNKITFKSGLKQFLEILSTSPEFPLLEELITNNENSQYSSFNELLKKILSYSSTAIKQCRSPDIVYIKAISQLLDIQNKRKLSYRPNYSYILTFVCVYLQTPIPEGFKTNNINTIITIIQSLFAQIENVNLHNGSFAEMQSIRDKVKEEKSLIISSYILYCSETLQTFNLSILEGETVLDFLLSNTETVQPSIVLDIFDIITSNINSLNLKKNFMNKLWLSIFEAFLLCFEKAWLQLSLESLMSITKFLNKTFRELIGKETKERDFDIILLKYYKLLERLNGYNFFREQYSRDFNYHFLLVIIKECLEMPDTENISVLVNYFANVYKNTLPQITTESTNQVLALDFLQVYFKQNKLLKVNFRKLHGLFFTFLLRLYGNRTVQKINGRVKFEEKNVFENLKFYLELEKEKIYKDTVLKCVLVQLKNCNIKCKALDKDLLDRILTNINFNNQNIGCSKDKINLLQLVIKRSSIQNFSTNYIKRIIDKITTNEAMIKRNEELCTFVAKFLKILSNHFFNFGLFISLSGLSNSLNHEVTTSVITSTNPELNIGELLRDLLDMCLIKIDTHKLNQVKSTTLQKTHFLSIASHFKTNTGNELHFKNVCQITAEIICSQLDRQINNGDNNIVNTCSDVLKELIEFIIESNKLEPFKLIFNKCHTLEKFEVISALEIFFKAIKSHRTIEYREFVYKNTEAFFKGYKNKKQVLEFIFNRFLSSKDKTNIMYDNFKEFIVNVFKVEPFNKFMLFKECAELASKKVEIRNDILSAFRSLNVIKKNDDYDIFEIIKYNEEEFMDDLKKRLSNMTYFILLSKYN
eukprot:GAHX01003526.1.p1 GENE.GAHX01003526.1~~GAHX01003526.1.p1  ORF type:complete len:823 (-),score=150.42 GAHX01003526.1:18-2486(-)